MLVTADGKRMISAANILPGSVVKTEERMARPLKYQYIEHAERTAIYRAAANGISTKGATMYCPWFACIDCARAIICAGVAEVVGHKDVRAKTPAHWIESIAMADGMLREAGVMMTFVEEPMDVEILFGETLTRF